MQWIGTFNAWRWFAAFLAAGTALAVGAGDDKSGSQSPDRPATTPKRTDVKPFEYVEAKVPFYPASKQWGKLGEPQTKMQKPLDPAESMKHFVTPVDFEVRLFANDQQLGGKPTCMTWDERGRLWVGISVDYPNELQPEGKGRDKIIICEDTDGDGVADHIIEFADNLSIPTSIAFHRGGIIVHQAPHTLYLKDTDGDDIADERQVLFTGWHTNDTHAGPSNLHYGHDNWYYGIVGYSGFDGTIAGEKHTFRTGFYRFKVAGSLREPGSAHGVSGLPSVEKFEFLRNTNNNSWGVGFSEEGILFGSTANGNPSVHLPIPNRYYESVRGWSSSVLGGIAGNAPMHPITDKVRQVDWHGHFTAAAGHALYTARTYPPEYWNRAAFVTEPTGHLVATFSIQPDGGSYRSHNAWNLLASDDEWSAPVMAEVGPDGHVWVIDWYNYIVQHNPTPQGFTTGKGNAYETPLRDKTHGRIYRVVYTKAKPAERMTLKDATPEKLVATLRHDNMFWRKHAQRLLIERGQKDVVSALLKLARDPSVDSVGLNPGVIHALWTLHGLAALNGSHREAFDTAVGTLRHKSAGVRRNALQVLPRDDRTAEVLFPSKVLTDSDPQVRLAAMLTVADLPNKFAPLELIFEILMNGDNFQDQWLSDAAISAAANDPQACLVTVARMSWVEPPPAKLVTLIERVSEHLIRGESVAAVVNIILQLPGAQDQVRAAILAGMLRGAPKVKSADLDAGRERILADILPKLPPSSRSQFIILGTRLGSKAMEKYVVEITASFLAKVRDEKETDANRLAAATQLMEFRKSDVAVAAELLTVISPRTGPDLARGVLDAIGRSEARETATALLERLPDMTPATRPAVIRILLGRTDWTGTLLDALDKGTIQLAELSLDQKQALAAHPNKKVAARAKKVLARGGGLPNADRQKVVAELLPLTEKTGDPTKGKAVYKEHCAKCHIHGTEGTRIGPDLTGMAAHPKAELLVNILDPSRDLEGNYRQYVVATKAGQVLTGLLASESKTAVELIDSEAKRHIVQRDDIEELKATPKSLMPEGFEKQLKPEQLTDLLEFLAQRGKYLPLPLHKAATVVSTRGMFNNPDSTVERLIFADWTPKEFEGVPFHLVDPQGDRVANVILLYGPSGKIPPTMPKSAAVPCNAPAKAIHLLSGVSGWGHPGGQPGSVSMIVRLHYEDGQTEDHELKNGEHFADYLRRVDVPGSKFAFNLNGRQVRYLTVTPKRTEKIKQIEFVKGEDKSAPVVMAVTVETGGGE